MDEFVYESRQELFSLFPFVDVDGLVLGFWVLTQSTCSLELGDHKIVSFASDSYGLDFF